MTRLGYIKRSPLRSKKKEPRVERIPLAILRPNEVKKDRSHIKVFTGGREVCDLLTKSGRDEYHRRVRAMWERQGKKCGLQISPQCKERNGRLLIDEAQFDHSNSRGMGGSKRDDRIIDDYYRPMNMAVCCWCNSLKGSRPLSDFDEVIP
jgi:hypothetical protein